MLPVISAIIESVRMLNEILPLIGRLKHLRIEIIIFIQLLRDVYVRTWNQRINFHLFAPQKVFLNRLYVIKLLYYVERASKVKLSAQPIAVH